MKIMKGEQTMAQSYLWKVEYHYYDTNESEWYYGSKTFTNKIVALKFANKLENNRRYYANIRLTKWFG